jgi:glucose/mannose transport system substrate-binding protein
VITGQAAGQIMGDWAQGEFQVAGQVAGKDYTCLPGMGLNAYISTGGDSFYFPKLKDPEKEAAQKRLAALLISPEVQVAFNLKKGSLPIRGDIDMAAANDCMKKGLQILASGNVLPTGDMVWSPDVVKQNEDLMVEFWKSDMAPEAAQAKYVENLKTGL